MSKTTLENKYYTEHLTELNKPNAVVTSEDIYNDKGALLVKNKTRLDPAVALQIARHKLRKPISDSITLENMLDQSKILICFNNLLKRHAELASIHTACKLAPVLENAVAFVCRYNALLQKLTVMQKTLPELFAKAIMGAWFAIAIAEEMEFSNQDVVDIFLGALVRDVGNLHIDPKLLNKTGKLTPAEWRSIQGHVILSRLVLDEVGSVPSLSKQVVMEHHERSDGAGYPHAKMGDALTMAGQVVAMADALQAIVFNQFVLSGHGVAHLQGFLAMNQETYTGDVYRAVMRLFNKGRLQAKCMQPKSKIPEFLKNIFQKNKKYLELCEQLEKLIPVLQPGSPRKAEVLLRNFVMRIRKMRASTGVPSKEYAEWVKHVYQEQIESAYDEMELVNLMLAELKWQFEQVLKYLNELAELEITSQEKKQIILSCIKRVTQTLQS